MVVLRWHQSAPRNLNLDCCATNYVYPVTLCVQKNASHSGSLHADKFTPYNVLMVFDSIRLTSSVSHVTLGNRKGCGALRNGQCIAGPCRVHSPPRGDWRTSLTFPHPKPHLTRVASLKRPASPKSYFLSSFVLPATLWLQVHECPEHRSRCMHELLVSGCLCLLRSLHMVCLVFAPRLSRVTCIAGHMDPHPCATAWSSRLGPESSL